MFKQGAVKDIFFSFCRTVTLFALECSRTPLGIINIVKLINDIGFNPYKELGLPSPIYPNIHQYGPYPVDVERWRYSDEFLVVTEGRYIDIPNGFRNLVLTKSEEILGKDCVNLIAEKVKNKTINRGSSFSAWITLLKQKWIERERFDGTKEQKMIYEKVYESLGNVQIEDLITLRSIDTKNWVVNPEFIEELPSWQRHEFIELKSSLVSQNVGVTTIPSKIQESKEVCHRLLHCLIKEKASLFRNNQGWRFRINKLSVKRRININELTGLGLYIGKFEPIQDRWFFVDTFYTRNDSDYISIEPFDEIKHIKNFPVVALLGQIIVENSEVKIFPLGVLKLL